MKSLNGLDDELNVLKSLLSNICDLNEAYKRPFSITEGSNSPSSYMLTSITNQKKTFTLCSLKQLLANKILMDLPKWHSIESVKSSYLNTLPLQKNKEICLCLKNKLKPSDQEVLYKIILMSKETNLINVAAANAASILNHSGYSFIGKNMKNVKIPYANLSGSLFISTDIQDSDLFGVDFSHASLLFTNFQGCNTENFNFKENQTCSLDKASFTSLVVSPCGKWLAMGDANGKIVIWDALKAIPDVPKLTLYVKSGEMPSANYIYSYQQLNIKLITYFHHQKLLLIICDSEVNRLLALDIETEEFHSIYSKNAYEGYLSTHLSASICKKYFAIWDSYSYQIWSTDSLQIIYQVNNLFDPYNVIFSPCNGYIACMCSNGFMRIENIYSGELVLNDPIGSEDSRKYGYGSIYLLQAAFCPIGKYLIASASNKGEIELRKINIQRKECETSLLAKYDENTVNELIYTNTGEYLILLTEASNIFVYDPWKKVLIWQNSIKNRFDKYSYLNTINEYLVCLCNGTSISMWKIEWFQTNENFDGHKDGVNTVVISKCGKYIASGGNDKIIKLWNSSNMKLIKDLVGHKKRIESLAFSYCGKYLASSGESVKIWSIDQLIELSTIMQKCIIYSLWFLPDNLLLAGWNNNSITMYDIENNRHKINLEGSQGIIKSISTSEQGKCIVVGKTNGGVDIWCKENNQWKKKLINSNQGCVYSVAISYCEKFLAIGGSNKAVSIWSIENAEIPIKTLIGHNNYVFSVKFLPCGQFIASGSADWRILLWDIETGNVIKEFKGHQGSVNSIFFSRCGNFLFSSSEDKTIKKWNLEPYMRRYEVSEEIADLMWTSMNGELVIQECNCLKSLTKN